MKLSILIPMYNEEDTLETIVERVLDVDYGVDEIEVVIVDDCSTDSSFDVAQEICEKYPNILIVQSRNQSRKRRCHSDSHEDLLPEISWLFRMRISSTIREIFRR